jgi:hypothetical protein
MLWLTYTFFFFDTIYSCFPRSSDRKVYQPLDVASFRGTTPSTISANYELALPFSRTCMGFNLEFVVRCKLNWKHLPEVYSLICLPPVMCSGSLTFSILRADSVLNPLLWNKRFIRLSVEVA